MLTHFALILSLLFLPRSLKEKKILRALTVITTDADPPLSVNDIDLFIASTLSRFNEYYHYLVTRGGI